MPADKVLRFNKYGKFNILCVADMHLRDTGEKELDDTLALLDGSLECFKPDLTVLLGDNVSNWKGKTPEGVEKLIKLATDIFDKHGSPFAVVFGNHDEESGVSKEEQIKLYQRSENCLMTAGFCEEGYGNYNLPILASDSDKMAFNLWMIDSGDHYVDENGKSHYAYVGDRQIEWFEKKNQEIRKANKGFPVYSLVFQHITVPEQYRLLKEVSPLTPFAIKGHGAWSDRHFVIAQPKYTKGMLGEGPCPPDVNNGQFTSWVKTGDVIGAVFGHDHINDFVGDVDGIKLIQTRGAGFQAYGDGVDRGVRIITIDESEPTKVSTETYTFPQIVGKPTSLPFKERITIREKRKLTVAAVGAGLGAAAGAAIGVLFNKIRKKSK